MKSAERPIVPTLTPRESDGRYELRVLLSPFPIVAPELDISMTAVLDLGADGCSYWAAEHPESNADFHKIFPDRIGLS